ncbi:hypothetical protein ILUMI_00280 [Ignelater luminosus]|uniref:Uncharacterized protein n=1 Tax=Ignelater luminosus TaxID=2038154 RepID=A0A8K0DSX9_IGNLU|nr:hypothetical protein ILUMI_00280 [Ignelater luminosus]
MTAKKQQRITDRFTNRSTVDQGVFDERILNFIIITMSAASIIDNPSFNDLFTGMGVHVMSRNTATKKIDINYTKLMNQIKEDISKTSYVCTTADIWSTKRRSFFGLTCHWINKNYERCSAALACKRFTGSHTYDKIAEMLESIHSEFNLHKDKLVATISDNGSNFVKAFREFQCDADDVLKLSTTSDGKEENDFSLSKATNEEEREFLDISSDLSSIDCPGM